MYNFSFVRTVDQRMDSVQDEVDMDSARQRLGRALARRQSQQDLVRHGIVPHNYFVDPMAVSNGQQLVREMISGQLEDFHERRPTLHELQRRNILPPEYVAQDIDHNEASRMQMERIQGIHTTLNEQLSRPRRPSITDLGDMHIIPHDYLDNLLVPDIHTLIDSL